MVALVMIAPVATWQTGSNTLSRAAAQTGTPTPTGATVSAASDGAYSFSNLTPGSYTIAATAPSLSLAAR